MEQLNIRLEIFDRSMNSIRDYLFTPAENVKVDCFEMILEDADS